MAVRKYSFAEGEFYHIYNRGTDKRNIFLDEGDFTRFLESLVEFNVLDPIGSIFENSFRKQQLESKASKSKEKLVEIVAYCLNPNHYHLILEQVEERGIEKFMQRLGTGYTKYINNKYVRTGTLFQGKFKAVPIDSNEYLLHLSAYINLNYKVHQLGSKASKSSWGEYLKKSGARSISTPDEVLGQFKNIHEYRLFAENSVAGTMARRGKLDAAILLE